MLTRMNIAPIIRGNQIEERLERMELLKFTKAQAGRETHVYERQSDP